MDESGTAPAPAPVAISGTCAYPACGAPLVTGAVCSGCRAARYCSAACQRADWPGHKAQCQQLRRAATAAVAAQPLSPTARTGAAAGPAPGVAAHEAASPTAGAAAAPAPAPKVGPPAFEPTLAAATAGDAGAQFHVAAMYAAGTRGAPKSPTTAFAWLAKCAAQGPDVAPRQVWAVYGDCYALGRGVDRDPAEAARLYRVGADRGDASAQYWLARAMEEGTGLPADPPGAFALYKAAAAQGYANALFSLGFCFAMGRGVGKDVHKAVKLFSRFIKQPRAAAHLVAMAKTNLGITFVNGDGGVPLDMERGLKYLHEAVAEGDETARKTLANLPPPPPPRAAAAESVAPTAEAPAAVETSAKLSAKAVGPAASEAL